MNGFLPLGFSLLFKPIFNLVNLLFDQVCVVCLDLKLVTIAVQVFTTLDDRGFNCFCFFCLLVFYERQVFINSFSLLPCFSCVLLHFLDHQLFFLFLNFFVIDFRELFPFLHRLYLLLFFFGNFDLRNWFQITRSLA